MEIVPAHADDFDAIVENFRQYRFALQKRRWLDWKYSENPYGGTLSFKIVEEGKLVGAVALLPRLFHYRGRRFTGVQAVDGLMGKEIRGKGRFNDVMEFLFRQEPTDTTNPYFYLSFPSLPASVKAHAFAGWRRLADFRLWTHVVDPSYFGRSGVTAWIAPLLRPFWSLMRMLLLGPAGRGVAVMPVERFTDDLTAMFPDDRVHGDRSAAFMNWRVIDNPQNRMRAFVLSEGGRPAGYLVVKEVGRTWEIMDIRLEAPRLRYLAAFLRHVGRSGLAESVDLSVLPGSPYRRLLPWLAFFRRGARGALFVHHTDAGGLPADPLLWELNTIDSDW